MLKFVYSKEATKFCEISTLLLSTVHTDKSKVEILQNFVAFSDYMNLRKKMKFENAKRVWSSIRDFWPTRLKFYLTLC